MYSRPTLIGVIILSCMIWTTDAFFPDHMNKHVPSDDYTLTDLTVDTLVYVVAQYFEESDPDRYDPGDLTGLDPLTPSTLFKAHYGTCVSSAGFQSAIDEILNQNLMVANKYAKKSEWHFNADRINKGNSRMVSIRLSILGILDNSSPDYSSARKKIGEFLHLLQSFYSNSNWIELNQRNNDIRHNRELGIIDVLSYRQAPSHELSCRNCKGPTTSPEDQDCKTNFDTFKFYLFSGYRNDQDVKKPGTYDPADIWGKCSHGGKLDSSWRKVATGGINKETSDPAISPHYPLHKIAAELAIEGGIDFFNDEEYGLYDIIGEEKFRRLMNLDEGGSLAMVIDDTGSMSEEIEAVKQETIELVNKYKDECIAPSNYIVSPFNDPGVGPLTDTTDPDVCIRALEALTAGGGGDCPELALTGLELALHRIVPESPVYVYTDADEKDSWKYSDVVALATEKKAIIKFILTGTCYPLATRNKRSPDIEVSSAFESIADATGGGIYHATDGDIDDVAGIMLADLRASQVSILEWSHNSFTNANITIPVDNTMGEMSISVSTDGYSSPRSVTFLYDPAGTLVPWTHPVIDIIVDSSREFIIILNTTISGAWRLDINGVITGNKLDVEVSARSLVDFSYQIMEEDEWGSLVPVDGMPVAGSNVTLQINVVSPELLNSTDNVVIKNGDGRNVLLKSALVSVGGRTPGYYTSDVTLPNETFTVSMIGKDINGYDILRLQPVKVQVVDFGLSILNDNNSVDNLAPGGEESFVFLVSNRGGNEILDISVSVTNLGSSNQTIVIGTVTPTSMGLNTMETAEGIVQLAAESSAAVGDSVLVTVEVISRSTSDRNAISMSITLIDPLPATEPVPVDGAPPTCTLMETGRNCTLEMINNDCKTHTWWARFSLQDDLALVEIAVSSDGLTGTEYTIEHAHPTNTTLLYQADCCCPYVNVSISDMADNDDMCEVDYYTPIQDSVIIDICIEAVPPSTTTVSPTTNIISEPNETSTTVPLLTTILKTTVSPRVTERKASTSKLTTESFVTIINSTTASRNTTDDGEKPDSEELSTGAKVGIGIAAGVALVVPVALLLYKFVFKTVTPKVGPSPVPENDISMGSRGKSPVVPDSDKHTTSDEPVTNPTT